MVVFLAVSFVVPLKEWPGTHFFSTMGACEVFRMPYLSQSCNHLEFIKGLVEDVR